MSFLEILSLETDGAESLLLLGSVVVGVVEEMERERIQQSLACYGPASESIPG